MMYNLVYDFVYKSKTERTNALLLRPIFHANYLQTIATNIDRDKTDFSVEDINGIICNAKHDIRKSGFSYKMIGYVYRYTYRETER